jgi:hypothetical protein
MRVARWADAIPRSPGRDHAKVTYAHEIGELMLEPAPQDMVQDLDWGGKGSR